MVEANNTTDKSFFLNREVKKGLTIGIRERIDTLLIERGLKWADVYNSLGWNKSFASIVHNGKFIPPNWQRVALAKQLGCDSSVIWDIPEIKSAEQLIKEEQGLNNPCLNNQNDN